MSLVSESFTVPADFVSTSSKFSDISVSRESDSYIVPVELSSVSSISIGSISRSMGVAGGC